MCLVKNLPTLTEDGGEKPKLDEVGRWKSDPTDSIKNLPTQTGGGEGKPNNQFNKKPSNPNGKWRRKTGKDQVGERSKTFLFA